VAESAGNLHHASTSVATPVSDLYESPFAFTGTLLRVMIDISDATFAELAANHEVRARFAPATQ